MINFKSLYPELIIFDGLPFAVQRRLSGSIHDLQIQSGISFSKWEEMKEQFEEHGLYHIPCVASTKIGRWANVDIAIEQHLYLLTLGSAGEKVEAFIEVDNFDEVLTFLSSWLHNIEVGQLENIEHFITLLNLKDDLQYIHWQWKSCHRNAVNFPAITGSLAPLFEKAMNDPILRQVTPYTSLTTLCLSGCTEFPFLANEYPRAFPVYPLGSHKRYIVQSRKFEQAERLLQQIPSGLGKVTKLDTGDYEFIERQGDRLCKGDAFEVLEFMISYCNERYVVTDAQGKGLQMDHVQEAVEFLRNALPANGYPSIRGSADDLDLEKLQRG